MFSTGDHCEDYMSDMVGCEMRNCLSWLQNPPKPERQCLCGFQEDGTHIAECWACKRWRKVKKLQDARLEHLKQGSVEQQVATAKEQLTLHMTLEAEVVAKREAYKQQVGRKLTVAEQAQWKNEANKHRRRIATSRNRLNIATKLLMQQVLELVDMEGVA